MAAIDVFQFDHLRERGDIDGRIDMALLVAASVTLRGNQYEPRTLMRRFGSGRAAEGP